MLAETVSGQQDFQSCLLCHFAQHMKQQQLPKACVQSGTEAAAETATAAPKMHRSR